MRIAEWYGEDLPAAFFTDASYEIHAGWRDVGRYGREGLDEWWCCFAQGSRVDMRKVGNGEALGRKVSRGRRTEGGEPLVFSIFDLC